jgi:hypothetical protein
MFRLIPPQLPPKLLLLNGSQHSPPSDIRRGPLVQRYLWNLQFKWPMDASNVTMKSRPADEVRFAKLAGANSLVHVWFVVHAVVQPAIDFQVLSPTIGLVRVLVVNSKDVAVFQIREPTICASIQSLSAPDIRNVWPDVRIAFSIFLTLPRRVLSKHVQRVIVTNERHDGQNDVIPPPCQSRRRFSPAIIRSDASRYKRT